MKKIISILACVCLLLSAMVIPVSAADSVTYTFSDYKENVAVTDYSKTLDDVITVGLYGTAGQGSGNFHDQLRVYQGAYCTITSAKNIESIVFNLGYKDGTYDVETSNDGVTWNLLIDDATYTKSYADHTITLTTPAKYIKYTSTAQTRIKTMTVTFAEAAGACTHDVCSYEANGDETHKVICDSCGETVSAAAECVDSEKDGVCDNCTGAVAIPFDPSTATPAEIVEAAYALQAGETIENVTLTGVVTSIGTAYNSSYKNVSLTIAVNDTDKTMYCYRLTADTDLLETLAGVTVEDTITVNGTIGVYNGAPQFQAGAKMTACEKGDFEVVVPEDPKEIVDEAFALEAGTSLLYDATLQGEVVEINEAYSESYKNITLTISVEGTDGMHDLLCYRLKAGEGADASTVKVGDVIAVTGTIKNYNGTIEFDNGCTFVMVKAAVGTEEYPEVLELQSNPMMPQFPPSANAETELAAENDGYYYTITATEDGAFALNISVVDAEWNSVGYQFSVTNTTTGTAYDAVIRAADAEDYYDTTMIPVVAGDTIVIKAGTYAAEAAAPAGTLNVRVGFAAVGSDSNPEVLELQSNPMMPQFPPSANAETELAEGNQGYFYKIVATEDGAFAINVSAIDADWNSVGYQFNVANNTAGIYSDAIARAADADDYYDTLMFPVSAGDEIIINAGTFNPEDAWNAPAGTLNVRIGFAAVGSYEYPEVLELQENPYMPQFPPSANAETELAEGNQGYYYTIVAEEDGVFIINVSAIDAEWNSVGYQFNVANNTAGIYSDAIARAADADDYYDSLIFPVKAGDEILINAGTFNPEDAWNAPAGTLNVRVNFAAVGSYDYPATIEATGAIVATLEAESQGYYYEWVATEDGIVTVTMNDEYGWQYNISKAPVDVDDYDNYYNSDTHWYDDETVVATEKVVVKAGETVKVWVNTYDPEMPWTAPAGTVNWTFDFQAVTFGDADSDGEVGGKDVAKLMQYLNEWDGVTVDEVAADVNGDGKLNGRDVALLLQYLNGWDVELG